MIAIQRGSASYSYDRVAFVLYDYVEFYSVTLAFRQTTGNKADGISEMAYQHCTVVNCSA